MTQLPVEAEAKIYTPSHIANFFLGKKKHDIDNLKLNKLVYISLGYHLAVLDKDLFLEDVEAWKYGPVIPSLYHGFKNYGWRVIDKSAQFFNYLTNELWKPEIEKTNEKTITLLESVWKYYGHLSAFELVARTHAIGTPWKATYDPNVYGKKIGKSLIKKYYQNLIKSK